MNSKLAKWLFSPVEHSMIFLFVGIALLVFCGMVGIFHDEAAFWLVRVTREMGVHFNGGRLASYFAMLPYMATTTCLVIMGGYMNGLKVAGWLGLFGMTALWAVQPTTIIPTAALVIAWLMTAGATVLTSETYMGTVYMNP